MEGVKGGESERFASTRLSHHWIPGDFELRREFFMVEVPREGLEFRWRPIRIHAAKGATGTIYIFLQVNTPVQIKKLPDLDKGIVAYLIIEILLYRDFHYAAFVRLPVIVAYEDCTRLAVRMEWQTPLGQRSTYL